MKVEKQGNYYRIQKQINGKRYNLSFDHKPSKKEVDEKVSEIRVGIVTQNNAPNKPFKVCCDNYIELKGNILSVSTIRGYKSIMRNLPQWFMDLKVKDIDQIAIQKLVNDYAGTHSPKSTSNLHGFIASVLSVYYPDLTIRTTLPMPESKEPYIPTREEVNKILDAVDGTRYYIPFKLACYGLRKSEVLALIYPDDFKGNMVSINKAKVLDDSNNYVIKSTKTTKSARVIYIDDDLLSRIKEQGYIYEGYHSKINERLKIEQDRLGIPRFTLHKLRHYFVSEVSRIMPEQDWLALGGYSSPNIAKKIYRHNRIAHDNEMKKKASEHLF